MLGPCRWSSRVARAWALGSDEANARLIVSHAHRANIRIRLDSTVAEYALHFRLVRGVHNVNSAVIAARILFTIISEASNSPKDGPEMFFAKNSEAKPIHIAAKQNRAAITAEDIVVKQFQPTKFREGYQQDQVDELLDRTVRELQRLDKEQQQLQQAIRLDRPVTHTAPVITPDEVMNARFKPTRFRDGYSRNQVDDFLNVIVTALRHRASENDQLRMRTSGAGRQYGTPTTSY